MPFFIVTVDGGAASGKSSTSKLLASKLNLLYAGTGLYYRALTRFFLDRKISPDDKMAIAVGLNELLFLIEVKVKGREAVFFLGDKAMTEDELKADDITKYVSTFAAIPEIRSFLKEFQRSHVDVAQRYGFNGLIMEGRDIGSVIFPLAEFRFFLEASEESRQQRRQKEGFSDSIHERDLADSTRSTAPLVCPDGAIRIDNSNKSLFEVAQAMLDVIQSTADAK
ncbi:MAG: hypothetical protein A2Y14_01685 [Verrucomicrobia bacterium GWF2_51_19]|nr:MAG: hypothetical protein A2Y14_01685 [Verrucomicrobia bacterium GWF2_51_19]HCJ12008.1 cytidylate kinase [Opitutae bacterium]